MTLPGFTAETSLCGTETNYRMIGAHGALARGAVVPQKQVCDDCSNFFVGTKVCCTMYCDGKYQPPDQCNVQDCHLVNCGLLLDVLGSIFSAE